MHGCDCVACEAARADPSRARAPASALLEVEGLRLPIDAGRTDLVERFSPVASTASRSRIFTPIIAIWRGNGSVLRHKAKAIKVLWRKRSAHHYRSRPAVSGEIRTPRLDAKCETPSPPCIGGPLRYHQRNIKRAFVIVLRQRQARVFPLEVIGRKFEKLPRTPAIAPWETSAWSSAARKRTPFSAVSTEPPCSAST